ncbi:MAG: asparagine--tRNA ligase [Nanoarchaeota archaeon]|nr:asparagine--tRNA ligase [Nanoarchaeota archaeon]MBU4242268.1 asparagine--tRNA ligase [Nanoarchaeota archaeon]MBU4352180.1 asparagine--tRNA ligase [Nanoarchaeota archaeon]MBU4455909.1 asparagine--tRNA ligase [Nanoarchaeota archaeon]
MSIQEALDKREGKVKLHGWVYRERKSKQIVFIVLRDSSNIVQCIVKKDIVSEAEWNIAEKILIESAVEIEGEIKEDSRAPTGFEVNVKKLNLISMAEPFPINKDQSTEFLADNRHLWLRSRKMTAIMKVRSTIFGAIHGFFRGKGFYEYQSPMFQSIQCEGGSTLFKLNYFGSEVFLAQTWQLYAEPAIFALEKIYTLAPSFRAEKSKTSRHLTEYWHAEMEVAWEGFLELQDYAEDLIKFVFKKVLEVNKEELKILERDVSKLEPVIKKPFVRMTYTEALDILKKKNKMDVKWGKDLRTVEEDELVKNYDVPLIVTCYPKEVKAFYMKENPDNPKTVLGFDLLAPEGYGEIIGASEREVDLEKLKSKLEAEGEDLENYGFYLDTRKYGSVQHAGFGMGVERLISWICGLDNIKDAIAFPRTPLRYKP